MERKTWLLNQRTKRKSFESQSSGLDTGSTDVIKMKRKSSSFSSPSSPWFRRNSFLSPSMIQSENFSVYESPSYYSEASSYNIISLKESQGFIFNQDLFASPYQQSRSVANERKFRALSFSKVDGNPRLLSNSKSSRNSSDPVQLASRVTGNKFKDRRHTSYDPSRPCFFNYDNKIGDEESEDAAVNESSEESNFDNDNALIDEYDEYEEMNDYGGDSSSRVYKVHVTEIVVNEDDNSIFPT